MKIEETPSERRFAPECLLASLLGSQRNKSQRSELSCWVVMLLACQGREPPPARD